MAAISRREHRSTVIWPGFVDALATLLMVIIFLLLIFVLAQFFLGQALSGRDQALRELQAELGELSEVLALSRNENRQLRLNIDGLQDQLSASVAARASLQTDLATLRSDLSATQQELRRLEAESLADKDAINRQLNEIADLSGDIAALRALKAELEKEVTTLSIRASQAEDKNTELAAQAAALEAQSQELETQLAAAQQRISDTESERDELQVGLAESQEIADSARAQLALLNQQMAALRQQLDALNQALDAAEAEAARKDVQIEALGQRLNAALASKVQELSRYRSEFFGRLRELMGTRADVRVVGDRFVLQSEVLFDKGSANLGEGGQQQLDAIATTLLEIALDMPGDLDWILRVDGHTDSDPIATAAFPSNWELSAARALSVVHHLEKAGVPPARMAATGFAAYYPIAEGDTESAKSRNRRIEFKFTQR